MMQNFFVMKLEVRLAFQNVVDHLLQNAVTDAVDDLELFQVIFSAVIQRREK